MADPITLPHPPVPEPDLRDGSAYHGILMTAPAFVPDWPSLVRNLRDLVYIVDLRGRFMCMNTNLAQSIGYSLDEARDLFMGRSFLDNLTPESQRIARSHFERALRGEAISPYFEAEAYCKDGSTIWLEIHGSHYFSGGRLMGRQGIARDITELRRLQAEVAHKSARLSAMQDRLRIANVLFDRIAELAGELPHAPVDAALAASDRLTGELCRRRLGLDDIDLRILEALTDGRTNAEIGQSVGLSPHTIKDRLERMMLAFDCSRRTALIARALRSGVI